MFLQTIKKIFSKKNIIIFILVAWIAFSVWYVARDQWQRFQYSQVQAAYQKGSSDTVKLLMEQANKCIKIPVQDGDKKIEVVKVGCSLKETPPKETPPKETPPKETPPKETATPSVKP